jgi:hypothetical protein
MRLVSGCQRALPHRSEPLNCAASGATCERVCHSVMAAAMSLILAISRLVVGIATNPWYS